MLLSPLMQLEIIIYGLVRKCVKLFRFGLKLYLQIVDIPMGTNCAPLVADLFSFCYERDFKLSLSDDNQSEVIEAFNSTSRYLDYLLNIDNNFFDSMVNHIYPSEGQCLRYQGLMFGFTLLRLNFFINEMVLILIL